jgi:V/A-type H+-transporting ATPase subunit C
LSSRTYVGTKAFALRGALLDRETVQKLAEATSLEELVNRLRGTQYSGSLESISRPFTARRLELALRERLAEVHHSLISSASRYKAIELYYLRHIGWDLKIVLKSKALNKPYSETMEYLDMKAEELVGRRDLLIKVLSARDIEEAVSLLSGTEFSADVENAFSLFSSGHEIRLFDVFIDHAVLSAISKEYSTNHKLYASARATDVAGVGDIVACDIDAYNVLCVLRSKLWRLPESDILPLLVAPTHRVSLLTLERMVESGSVAEAAELAGIARTSSAQGGSEDDRAVDEAEEGFAIETRETAAKAFFWQGLGPGPTLALIRLLEFEVNNLAAIAIGVETKMSPSTILAKLRM